MTHCIYKFKFTDKKVTFLQALKNIVLVLVASTSISSINVAQADIVQVPNDSLTMNDELREDVYQMLYQLHYGHYLPNELNDEASAKTLDAYLELLDPNKVFFTQSDITQFQAYRTKIDDLLKKRNAEVAFDIFKVFRQRMQERTELILSLIKQDFDFTKKETINIDRESYQWAKNEAELNAMWRKRIKNDMLQQMLDETPLDEIRSNLTRRYERQRDITFQLKADEVFEWFMNAYAKELGPHTQYMSHITAENFRINMSLSLQGIGAALQSEKDYTVINRIVPGGPAELSGAIDPEDKIIAVGQEGEEMINVIGWRLMDVVQMIRGDKGTKVTLQVKKNNRAPGSPPITVELVRDIIKLEDQAAQLKQIEVPVQSSKDGAKQLVSVIRIPSFYSNTDQSGDGEIVATTHDVLKLLQEVKKSDSQGLVIDLRGNGGGYLNEAISLTGLFIDKGPVVQVVQSNHKRQVLNDTDSSVAYDGPLMVLIDRYSASASEIFAAAMQDYGRAIIVGERSFGKGTVQRVSPLRYGKNVEHESQLKLTTAQFFRVNGGSTQHKGVTPDVILNSGAEDEEFGERSYDNALPWSKTDSAQYKSQSIPSSLVAYLSERHLERSKTSPAFNFLRLNSQRISKNKDIKELPLSITERKAINEKMEQQAIGELNAYRESLGLDPVTMETQDENPLPGEDEHWNIVFHTEAANILLDLLQKPNTFNGTEVTQQHAKPVKN